jgi:hypothetical protein
MLTTTETPGGQGIGLQSNRRDTKHSTTTQGRAHWVFVNWTLGLTGYTVKSPRSLSGKMAG